MLTDRTELLFLLATATSSFSMGCIRGLVITLLVTRRRIRVAVLSSIATASAAAAAAAPEPVDWPAGGLVSHE